FGALPFDVRFGLRDLVVIAATIPILLGLQYVVTRTKIGKAMRATAQDRDASALMGININRTIAFAFLLGGALAGAAGVMYGQYTGTTDYLRGFETGLKAFTAAVLGGIGNLTGAVLGGILIGIIQAMSDRYLSSSYTNAVIFAVLIVILVFRPSGLLGEQTADKA
ncbi:MAG: branched-chain amino acid ABC transporter permease, partial [Chloroflexota bacterium]|nr:branched-chain amino acid ABC transporter permease [Chloroflexota bacterium]